MVLQFVVGSITAIQDFQTSSHKLLEVKKATQEKDLRPHIPGIMAFIRSELEKQKQIVAGMKDDRRLEWDTLNEIFQDVLSRQKARKL